MYYYQFDIDKWIKRTHYLLPEEEGIYLRLVNYYYDTEKPLPLDLRLVCRRLRLEAYWEQMQQIVHEFFEETPEGWKNSKCDRNIAYVNERALRNKENGRKGGRPRNQNNLEKSETEPKQNPEITQSVISGKPKRNPDESQTKGTDDNFDTVKGNGSYATCVRFDEFWEAYPRDRRRDKKKAQATWKRRKLDNMADLIINDVKNRVENDDQWKRGFSPMPTTYLNGDRWEDELSGDDDPPQPKSWETGI